MKKKWVTLVTALIVVVSSSANSVEARGKQSKARKTPAKQKSGLWPASQKSAAKRALNALEEMDKWIKYYPSPTVAEFKKRSADTAYIVNQNVAALPVGTVKSKIRNGFRWIQSCRFRL